MGKQIKDISNQTFGRWTAIKKAKKPDGCSQTGQYWLFRCSCGTEKILRGASISNRGGSCGCLKSEVSSKSMKKMQRERHGTIEERFLSRFKVSNSSCWLWISNADKDGYGVLTGHKSHIRAHRFSYEYHNKTKIGAGLVVCHSCDNPSCVNPDHLFLGTVYDNCHDMLNKERDSMVGSRNNKAKLTELDIPKIRNSKSSNSVVANEFGVSISTIKRIRSYKMWRHVE